MGKSVVSKYLSELGKRGGKARLKTMTAARRREVARMAGLASAKVRRAKAKKRSEN